MQQLPLPIKVVEERLHHLPYRERLQKLLESDLEFHGRNSKYFTHGWHAFPAKFPPQLPRKFITELTPPGDIILDPMAGKTPHIVIVTAEPYPQRIASLALGTGDIDCVYHFALTELQTATKQQNNPAILDMLDMLVSGKRLRDIGDLPFDLAA